MARYSYAMLFKDFRRDYPDMWRKGTSYLPAGFMAIEVRIPGVGIYKYEFFGKKLTMIKKFLTRSQEKYRKVFEREQKMIDISDTMKERGISQRRLSELSGVSRESINRYMSGKRVPKLSTLEMLEGALDIYNEHEERA